MSDDERWITIPRWDDFQHRDMARTTIPPWIKNYTRLLHDDNYLNLTQSQRGLLHGIWLLYASHRRVLSESRTKRLLVHNQGELRYWTRNLEALSHAGFIQLSAGNAAGKDALPLARTREEVEEEKNKELRTYEEPLATPREKHEEHDVEEPSQIDYEELLRSITGGP